MDGVQEWGQSTLVVAGLPSAVSGLLATIKHPAETVKGFKMSLNPRRIEVADPIVVSIVQKMSPTERLAIAGRMWISARDAILCHLRADYPDWSDNQIQSELLRRMTRGNV